MLWLAGRAGNLLSLFAGDFLDFGGVYLSGYLSTDTKLLCDNLGGKSACNSSSSSSSLFLFLAFLTSGSLRVALSSRHNCRGSPNASTVLDEEVCSSSRVRSTEAGPSRRGRRLESIVDVFEKLSFTSLLTAAEHPRRYLISCSQFARTLAQLTQRTLVPFSCVVLSEGLSK